ncbi:MAG: DUF2971 domain-containing protein [Emcibacteraceae bacterium]|nr:DUF2971 domain-containing protein [Emcibacteraceae bacterium]
MFSEIPDRIYRYQRFSALSLDALCLDKLYFSDPNVFNDPLDCQPAIEPDSDNEALRLILRTLIEQRVTLEVLASLKNANIEGNNANIHSEKQAHQTAENTIQSIAYYATEPDIAPSVEEAERYSLANEIKKELLKQINRGVCCLSQEYDNPLLWSHYGDQHHGFCVGYTLNRNPKPKINKVLYGGLRTIKTSLISEAILNKNSEAKEELDKNIWLRKAEPWGYEKEWRIFNTVGLMDSPLLLSEITFGLRCSYPVMYSVIAALKPRDIKFYQMYFSGNSFELDRSEADVDLLCTELPHKSRSGFEAFGPPHEE